jgi:phospholipase C
MGAALCALAGTFALAASVSTDVHPSDRQVPRYDHVFLVIEENRSYEAILGDTYAPNLSRLANTYGSATGFYAERHPSEPNYVAISSGSTYGVKDDNSFTINSVDAPNIATQLDAHRLTWGGYFGGYDPSKPLATTTAQLYASKHNPFVNFSTLRSQPGYAAHQHTLDALSADLKSGTVPNFTAIVPGLCDDMHGAPACRDELKNVTQGDRVAAQIVAQIQSSALWHSAKNEAIVITWDENDGLHRFTGTQGCCGALPGGGRIPTIVITNHGPHALKDDTAYNHYSLLRTLEDAFGIQEYLAGAGDWADGVRPMTPLFAVKAATISATAK